MNITQDVIKEVEETVSDPSGSSRLHSWVQRNEPVFYAWMSKQARAIVSGFDPQQQDVVRNLIMFSMSVGFVSQTIATSKVFMDNNKINIENEVDTVSKYNAWLSGSMDDKYYQVTDAIDPASLGGDWEMAVKNHEDYKKNSTMNDAKRKLADSLV
jgi:hypothetical protein